MGGFRVEDAFTVLRLDTTSGLMVNESAQPAPSELTYDGNPTSNFWDRMFTDSGGSDAQIRRLSAVWACVYVLSSAIGLMPFRLYRRDGQSSQEETSHRLAGFLADSPDDARSWQEYRESAMMQCLYKGNGYSQNFWRNGHLVETFLWDEGSLEAKRVNNSRRIAYEVGSNDYGIQPKKYFRPDVTHFKGIKSQGLLGISPMEHCKNALQSAAAHGRHQRKSAERGAPLKGIITGVEPFRNREQADAVRARWAEAFEKAQGDSGVPIFEGNGMKFNSIAMTNTDAQFIEVMNFSVEDIARIFNLPPHQIQHLERATNNNIDILNQEYYKSSLLPWKLRMESQANRDWLTPADRRAGLYVALDPTEFLKADVVKWTESLTKQVAGGMLKPNEARAKAQLPAVEHGDILRVPANTVPVGYDPSDAKGTPSQPPEN